MARIPAGLPEHIEKWMKWRVQEDDRLYELYGKPLEPEHNGKIVAIGPAGEVILGGTVAEVAEKAVASFGEGNFAVRRVGHQAVWKLRALSANAAFAQEGGSGNDRHAHF
ncbi:MAG: hypothetical protein HYY01_00135 [Chloroflexi bacterium]|nr:hypothetical protein [Chloroflexota bacterium]